MTDNDDKDKRGGPRPPRGDKPSQPRGDKPFRSRDGGDRSLRRPAGDRPPRKDFGDRPPRREDGDRPRSFKPREGGDRPAGDRPPRRDFGDRPPRKDFGDRPRSFKPREGGDRPAGDRPPRRDFGDRPPRKDFGDRPPRRDFGDRPPRREDGDRPRSFKPREGGDRPAGDRPPRRDFGDRAPRRDFGDRPPRRDAGDRPPRTEDDNANRIAKVIARAGLCSRRDAEAWIEAGRVAVNGAVISSPALDVSDSDRIEVDGVALPARERTRLWLYHKPKGLETTEHSPEGRPTVFDNLPPGLPRVMSVGRLDINTEGLLLLTNDGGLARVLAHPKTAWLRRYRVRVYGPVDQAKLDSLQNGITIEDPEDGEVTYAPIVARVERSRGDNSWISMDLREGKNREIKKVLEHFGLQVTRLIRISFGPFQLGDMPEGTAEEIRGRHLRDQLGERLAEEAGCDFDGPAADHAAPAGDRPARAAPARPRQDRDERPARDRYQREARPGSQDGFEQEPERGSTQDREGRSKTAWSEGPLPERRRDSKKPGEKRSAAVLGERDDLKVTREKVADRKGREVKVERVAKIPQDVEDAPAYAVRDPNRRFGKRADAAGDRPPRRDFGDRPPRREDGDRPRSFKPREGGDRPARDFGDRPPRRDFGDRPPRKDFGDRPPRRDFGDRPPRREDGDRPRGFKPREGGDRPPRDFGDRPPRRDFGDRPPRRDFGDRPPRREDGDRPRSFKPREGGDRPPRDFGDRPPRRDFGDRPPRRDFGDRPPRRDDGERPSFGKPRADRPPRDFGDRPPRRDDGERKPYAGKSFGGKPGSKPFGGGRPGGGKSFGGKPGGGRPFGGKPGGGKPFGGRPGGAGPRGGGADRRR